MKYDFESIIDRKNTNSLKWDLFDDDYPMWVADMDFKSAPAIYEAVNRNARHGVYAYSITTDALFESYVNWWKRYGLLMKKEELLFVTGVVPAITSIIRAFSKEGDNVLIQTPVYHVFFYVIEDNNRNVLENPLIYHPDEEDINKAYQIDFEDLEEKLSDPKTKIFILCNPHNPIGRIWEKDDLKRMGELAKKYDVLLISDEIHCDLTDPGTQYVPLASLEDELSLNSLTCISPTKTFNMAGLKSAAIYAKNNDLYEIIEKQLKIDLFFEASYFAVDATIAAYESEEWLNQLRQRLFDNKIILNDFLKNEIPEIRLVPSNATYLLWLDISKINNEFNCGSNDLSSFLREEVGLFVSPGIQFGENGDDFLRINVACPQKLLIEGLNALKEGIEKFKNQA